MRFVHTRTAFNDFRHSSRVLAAAALIIAGLATLALAHNGATGVVKERMELMKRQQKDMKLIGDMAKSKTTFDAGKAAEAARDISVTAKQIHELFPEGSGGHPSDAKPTVWTDWDAFTEKAKALDLSADALAAALDDPAGADWKGAFQKLTDACKACHQTFRAESAGQHH